MMMQIQTQIKPTANWSSIFIFRCDDYGLETRDSALVEQKLLEIFAKHGFRLVFGVVPQSLETRPDKIEYLKSYVDSDAVEIALHGWDHQPDPHLLAVRGISSEFVGRTYREQVERISKGKQTLEKWFAKPVRSFIPPWNTSDLTTLQACADVGIQVLSANINAPASADYPSVVLMPSIVTLPFLAGLVDHWQKRPNTNRIAIVLFHAYEFYESKDERAFFSLEEFDKILERIKGLPDVKTLTLSEAAEQLGPQFTYERLHTAQRAYRLATKIYGTKWRNRIGNYVGIPINFEYSGYETTTFYMVQIIKQRILYLLPFIIYLCLALVLAWLQGIARRHQILRQLL